MASHATNALVRALRTTLEMYHYPCPLQPDYCPVCELLEYANHHAKTGEPKANPPTDLYMIDQMHSPYFVRATKRKAPTNGKANLSRANQENPGSL